MRKLKGFLLITLIPLMLSGCWDKVELENRGFVITIGVDKNEGAEPFAVSMAIANVEAISGKGGEKDKETVKKAKSETLADAMHIVDAQISQKIYYGHTKLVVLGEKFLEDPDMLREAVDALERNNEINQKIIVVAAEGEASKILDEQVKDDALVGIYISNFYKNNQKRSSTTSKLDLEKLIKSLRLTGGAIIPQVKTEDKGIKLGGAAVIKDFKLDGWLTEDDMRGFLWFKQQAGGEQVIARHKTGDKEIPVAFIVNQNKRTISFSENENKLVCTVNVSVKGAVEEYKLLEQSLFAHENIEKLQAEYENVIAGQLNKTFALFREKHKIDGFLLKDYLKKQDYQLYLKYESDWDNAYGQMIFAPKVSVSITNTGAIK